jgi:alpha-tubulin suppressor-like RCC1 family protein
MQTAPVQVLGIANAVSVKSTRTSNCALTSAGTVLCWGQNDRGQVGNGTQSVPVSTPTSPLTGAMAPLSPLSGATSISAGDPSSFCAATGSSTYCWGSSLSDTLLGVSFADTTKATVVSGVPPAGLLSMGYEFQVKVISGALCPWGANNVVMTVGPGGSMTFMNPTGQCFSANSFISGLTSGFAHSCAIDGGPVRCWGSNSFGQLGNGLGGDGMGMGGTQTSLAPPGSFIPSLVASKVASGAYHVCAIGTDTAKTVSCWGYTMQGQINGNFSTRYYSPVAVPLGLPAGLTPVDIWSSPGASTTCVTVSDGSLWCWGANSTGQVDGSQGIIVPVPTPFPANW